MRLRRQRLTAKLFVVASRKMMMHPCKVVDVNVDFQQTNGIVAKVNSTKKAMLQKTL